MQKMKAMLKQIFVLLGIVSCIADGGFSQTTLRPCKLTVNDSPVLRGYRLGMNLAEIDRSNIVETATYHEENSVKVQYDDSTYYLTFENSKLRLMSVFYKSLHFNDLQAFVTHLDTELNLPDSWTKQTPEQIDIEKTLPDIEEQFATALALRGLMLQIHGKKCRHARRMERAIPKMIAARAELETKRQIGWKLSCQGFSVIAFIDNSIEKGIPSLHLFLPETSDGLRIKP